MFSTLLPKSLELSLVVLCYSILQHILCCVVSIPKDGFSHDVVHLMMVGPRRESWINFHRIAQR